MAGAMCVVCQGWPALAYCGLDKRDSHRHHHRRLLLLPSLSLSLRTNNAWRLVIMFILIWRLLARISSVALLCLLSLYVCSMFSQRSNHLVHSVELPAY
jgi:hypothetical protein